MIKFERLASKGKISLAVTGHANFAPKGFDIVCASVSAIVQAAAVGCQHYDPSTKIDARDGDFLFACGDRPKTRAIIHAAELGLRQIKEQYPVCFDDVDVLRR